MNKVDEIVDPSTPEEWQMAVNGAEFWLMVDSAIQYGLMQMTGEDGKPMEGSGVNVNRCLEILETGKALGIVPDPKILEHIKSTIPSRYSPPGRRCKLPRDYFTQIKSGRQ